MAVTDDQAASAGFAVPADDAPVHEAPAYIRQNARAAAVGPWMAVSNQNSSLVEDYPGSYPGSGLLKVRMTPMGVQMKGELRATGTIERDAVLFVLPSIFRPDYPTRIHLPTMATGGTSNYVNLAHQAEVQVGGNVTARQQITSGQRISFTAIYPLYDD